MLHFDFGPFASWAREDARKRSASMSAAAHRGDTRDRCSAGHLTCARCDECLCAEIWIRSDHHGLTACTDCRRLIRAQGLLSAFVEPWRVSAGGRPRLTVTKR